MVTLTLGLLLEAVCLTAMLVVYRTRVISRVGGLFVIVAVAFHGLSELLYRLDPGADPYRAGIARVSVEEWVATVGTALLIFTAVYLYTASVVPNREPQTADEGGAVAGLFDWRVALLVALPLIVFTVRGSGYAASGQGTYASSGLSDQFLIVLVVLTAYLWLVKHGPRRLLPVLAVQSVILAFVGQRLEIAIGGVMLLFAAHRLGYRLTRRQTAACTVGLILFLLTISSTRAVEGRAAFQTQSGPGSRASALLTGFTHLWSPSGLRDAVTEGYVDRFDGNSYPAFIASRYTATRVPPAGVRPLVNDLKLAVPSFINPAKLSTDPLSRNEKAYLDGQFSWPQTTDIVEGQLPGAYGMFGRWGLYGAAGLLGLVFAGVDRYLDRRRGAAPLLVGFGFIEAVMFYERGFLAYTFVLRGILLLLAAAGLVWLVRVAPRRAKGWLRPPVTECTTRRIRKSHLSPGR